MAELALRVGCHPWARISAATLAVRMKRSSVTELGVSINVMTADKRQTACNCRDRRRHEPSLVSRIGYR